MRFNYEARVFRKGLIALLDNIAHNALDLSVRKIRKTNTRLLIPNTNWDIREVKSGSNTLGTFYRIWE